MATLATVRGLAIAASFVTAGSLASSSFVAIPSILSIADDEGITAQTLATQFRLAYQHGRITEAPAELFAMLAFGYLAFQARSTGADALTWKLYSAAAVAVFTVVPWTALVMEEDSQKIVSLADPPVSHAKDKEPKLEHGGQLAVPKSQGPSITPVEEFEPFDDSPFSGAEYEKMKVKKLLQTWKTRNMLPIVSTAAAGMLAISAITTRITLVTIVQGQ